MEKLVYKLPVFEGPLDALLYLIARHKLNICDIPIAELLAQYLDYMQSAQRMDMELTSEFLEMASRLVQMKSSMLLPRPEKDPRGELVTALLAYQACKRMAQALTARRLPLFVRLPQPFPQEQTYRLHHAPAELAKAFRAACGRTPPKRRAPDAASFSGVVVRAAVSVTRGVLHVLRALRRGGRARMPVLFVHAEGRSEAIATFLAVLELVRAGRVHAQGQGRETVLTLAEGAEHENG